MSTKSGRYHTIKKGTYTVSELGSFRLAMNTPEIDTSSFGSTWSKSDVGMKKWTLSISGFCDPTDTNGQAALEAAYMDGSLVNDLKVYVDNTSYWVPDVTTDSDAGGRITSYEIGGDKAGVASLSMTLTGSGPITFV